MDSLTHIALGACIGELTVGRKLGKTKAMFLGALANSFPDIDFVASLWSSQTENMLAHRGFTHSFLFLTFFSLLAAYASKRFFKSVALSYKAWLGFYFLQLFVHILLDALNIYGVGWLVPFSNYRFSFNWLFVVDLFFSIWVIAAFFLLLFTKASSTARRKIALLGLSFSAAYLCYAGYNKFTIDKNISQAIHAQQIPSKRFFTTPAPFNTWLWYVVAEVEGGFQVGYHSVFDKKQKVDLHFFPKNEVATHIYSKTEDFDRLATFSRGYWIAQNKNDTLYFTDLRFGQIMGWSNPNADFVFNYNLQYPADNLLALQRGRLAGWNRKAVSDLINRIRGE